MSRKVVRKLNCHRSLAFVSNPLASRNKWAIVGRNLAYFVASLLYILSSFLLAAIISIFLKIWNSRSNFSRKNPKKRMDDADNELPNKDQIFRPVSIKGYVNFCEIAGLEFVKEQIVQRMIMPFQYPDKAEALGIPKGGGVLLFGPPGTGKTLLARAVAGELKAAFFHVQPGDLIRTGVGKSLERVSELFSALRKYNLAVLFLDEADDIVANRSGSAIVDQIRGQFQRELDGFESEMSDHTLLLIAATNQPWNISKAMCRPGRCDIRVYVGLPDFAARLKILEIESKKRLTAEGIDWIFWAEKLKGYSGADLAMFIQQAAQNAFSRSKETKPINQDDLDLAYTQVKPSIASQDLDCFIKYCKKYNIPME